MAWDGEGITYPTNKAQSYVLFGASTGDRVVKPELDTATCLDLLLAVEETYPDAIHVGFAFQYDVNMILRSLSRRHLENIYYTNVCHWEGYRIEYRPGKWFSIRRGDTRVRVFDVWGFFQSSFVVACERFLGKDDPELVRIREGKAARSSFQWDELEPFIIPYWEAELRLLVRVMDSLRDDLLSAELPVTSWHGPGAVANTVFRVNQIGKAKAETPKEVNRAAQYAYAGGRFEQFRCGHYPATVWEYDINSAYPHVIAQLPNLQRGSWRHTGTFEPESFGVWRVAFDASDEVRQLFYAPRPLFVRDKHGNVSFPPLALGWYWTPEAALVDPGCILEGWVFDHDGTKPFAFVEEMYERRKTWKQAGNSAEKALKLALNSLYGKMAQRVGWTEATGIPRWHQLEWAGYVTSATRALLWSAISLSPEAVIAVETDALFTTQPLPLDLGSGLGQWEATEFPWLTYFQSGVYYSEGVAKYRGFDHGSLSHSAVLDHLRSIDQGQPYPLSGATTRFVGFGLALHTRATWRSWTTTQRGIELGGGGKRAHIPGCSACKAGVGLAEGLHPLAVVTAGGRSEPHGLPWLEGVEHELRQEDELTRW